MDISPKGANNIIVPTRRVIGSISTPIYAINLKIPAAAAMARQKRPVKPNNRNG
jgi:hypothetical protein